jgi:hypothetical protein
VAEHRYADLFKLQHVAAGFVADLLAAVQVRYPSVPIVFCDTRPLAEEWTFRFLGAALAHLEAEHDSGPRGATTSRCQGRPAGRPAGTANRRPLTTTGIITKHNRKRPPARAGLQATRARQSAVHTTLFRLDVLCHFLSSSMANRRASAQALRTPGTPLTGGVGAKLW